MHVSWKQGEVAFGLVCYLFYCRIGKILAEPPKPDIVVAFTTGTLTKLQQLCRCLTVETADVPSRCFTPPSGLASSLALQLFKQISDILFSLTGLAFLGPSLLIGTTRSCDSRKNDTHTQMRST